MAKIIAVDDSAADLKFAEAVLLKGNHRVIALSDNDEVEERIATELPDLVLLDIVMPKRNGYELLRKIKRNDATKNIRVIMVSSKGQPTDIEWGKRQGADGYVIKPYTPEELLSTVGSLLG